MGNLKPTDNKRARAATEASSNHDPYRKVYIITGPKSGIGRTTAFNGIKHWIVILIGRDRHKLSELQQGLRKTGGRAISVVCDMSDIARAGACDISVPLRLLRRSRQCP